VNQILNEWESKLEDHVNGYIQHGAQIRHWDQKLFENQSSIRSLQREVGNLQNSQRAFNTDLERIRAQQINLGAIIESLEKDLKATPALGVGVHSDYGLQRQFGGGQSEKNVTREGVYGLAETIDQNLNTLNERLQAKIAELNQSNQKFKDSKHPLTPVVDILNNHLASLNWIDNKTNVISDRLSQMQQQMPKQ